MTIPYLNTASRGYSPRALVRSATVRTPVHACKYAATLS